MCAGTSDFRRSQTAATAFAAHRVMYRASSLFSGARICVSGVHNNGAREILRGALRTDYYWRGTDLITRKHSCNGRGNVGDNQRQIMFPSFLRAFARADFFDVAKHGGASETARRANQAEDLSKRIFQIRPDVSGYPRMRLKHWIA